MNIRDVPETERNDLIHEGIATVQISIFRFSLARTERPDSRRDCDPDCFCFLFLLLGLSAERNDLIHEGIATSKSRNLSCSGRLLERNDLIHEGIATSPSEHIS